MALRNTAQPRGASTRIRAIEIGFSAVRAVEIEGTHGGPRVVKKGQAPLLPTCLDDPVLLRANLPGAIRAALAQAGIGSGKAVASVPRRMVTLKFARLPHATPEQIAGMVQFEAQQYIPFPIEEVTLDHEIVSDPSEELTTVMIAAARRSLIEEVMAAFDAAGVNVERLAVSSLALAELCRDAVVPTAILSVEPAAIDMAVVADGRVVFSRAAALSDEGRSSAATNVIVEEIVRSFAAYENEHRGHPIGAVRIAGSPATIHQLEEPLREVLGTDTTLLNGSLFTREDQTNLEYAGTIGLALSEVASPLAHINLVPASRLERRRAARRRIQTAIAMVGILALLAAAGAWASRSIENQRAELVRARRENDRLTMAQKVLDRVKQQHDRVLKAYQTVAGGLDRDHPLVEVFKAVSDAVPRQGVYLTQFAMDRANQITIHGNTLSEGGATAMVLALQRSPLLSDVRLGYLGDTAADTNAGSASAAAKPGQPKKMSFIISCRLPIPNAGAAASGSSAVRAGNNTSSAGGSAP
ncbi:MAG: pilus assembly protein PilM [Chthonomonadales bacterium]